MAFSLSIEYANAMPGSQQIVDQMGANEPIAAEYKRPHPFTPA